MALGFDNILKLIMAGIGGASMFTGGGGSGQERATFEGESRGDMSLDPRDMLGQGITSIGRFGEDLYDRFQQGSYLPGAFAQSPPTFTGGGLPMPIGVTGRDLQEAGAEQQWPHLRAGGPGGGAVRRDPFQSVGQAMSGDPTRPRGGGGVPDDYGRPGTPTGPDQGRDNPYDDAYAAIDLLSGSPEDERNRG